jgi:serine phosphatase RsbU (regulator of sigma subunit)
VSEGDVGLRGIDPKDPWYFKGIVDTLREPLIVMNSGYEVVFLNQAFHRAFPSSEAGQDEKPRQIYELGGGEWDIPALRHLLENTLPEGREINDLVLNHHFGSVGPKVLLINARLLELPVYPEAIILLAMEDITEQRRLEGLYREATERQGLRDRHIAEMLQLPLTLEIQEDAFPGMSVATLFQPALKEAEVGGDFYDAFELRGGLVALAVGDASGKGLAAAARIIQVKDVLRAFARERRQTPSQILSRINRYLCETDHFAAERSDTFVCLTLALYNPDTGEGNLVSGGCEPPCIIRAGGGTEEFNFSNFPLGLYPDETYGVRPFTLDRGDTLMLMTDGLTEAREGRGRMIGYERVVELARQSLIVPPPVPSLRAAGKKILDGICRYGGGALQDDACLLLARAT